MKRVYILMEHDETLIQEELDYLTSLLRENGEYDELKFCMDGIYKNRDTLKKELELYPGSYVLVSINKRIAMFPKMFVDVLKELLSIQTSTQLNSWFICRYLADELQKCMCANKKITPERIDMWKEQLRLY